MRPAQTWIPTTSRGALVIFADRVRGMGPTIGRNHGSPRQARQKAQDAAEQLGRLFPPVQGAQGCCSAIWRALALDPAESGRAGIDDDRLLVAVKPIVTIPASMIAEIVASPLMVSNSGRIACAGFLDSWDSVSDDFSWTKSMG